MWHGGERAEAPSRRGRTVTWLALLMLVTLSSPSAASQIELSGAEGHPRERLPLSVHVPAIPDAALTAAAKRAVSDWNALVQDALGLEAFAEVDTAEGAQVNVTFRTRSATHVMGLTRIEADGAGVITPAVRIVILEPQGRGQTARDVILYQVLAHELGHALGLVHTRDPRSVMCCVPGSIDFDDPAVREKYVAARRHPDLRSVREQLVEHYERFWKSRR